MIYLMNNREEVVEIINHGDIYVNNEKLRLTDENYVSYILTAEVKYLPTHITDQVSYVMVGNDANYQAYFVSKIETNNNRTAITGVSSIVEQLRKTIVPQLVGEQTLQSALTETLRKTDIDLVIDASIASKPVYSELYYVQAWEAIKELSHYYGFEMDFRVNYDSAENEQYDAYRKQLVITPELGIDKPEEAVIYGYNAKSFVSEHDKTKMVTALYGFGKPITQTKRFKDYETQVQERLKALHGRHWQSFVPEYGFDENNPPKVDFSAVEANDKPFGSAYIGVNEHSAEMTSLGIYDRTMGQYKHKYDVIHFADLEDPQAILNATRQELKRRIKEDMYYQVTADGLNVDIGDAIQVGSDDMLADSAVAQARVIEFTRDNLLNRNKDIRVGEHITKSRNRKRRELNEDMGIEPLVNDPALSNYGTPSERGYGTNLSNSLRGIDDLLFDSLAGLDEFGDWGLDELGNTGLDFSTLDSGLNTGDWGSGTPGEDGETPDGFTGHGPHLKMVIDSAPVNKFSTDSERLLAKLSTSVYTGLDSVFTLGSEGAYSMNEYTLGDDDGDMPERQEVEHEASISIHGYDGGIDIDKPVSHGNAGTALGVRDMFIGLVNTNYKNTTTGDGDASNEGIPPLPSDELKSVMEFEDTPLKVGVVPFERRRTYEMNKHPFSVGFKGLKVTVGTTHHDLNGGNDAKNGVLLTENNGMFIKDIYTKALIQQAIRESALEDSNIHQAVQRDGYYIQSSSVVPYEYISLVDYIKYAASGLFDELDIVRNKDILAGDVDNQALPTLEELNNGLTREEYERRIHEGKDRPEDRNDPGKYIYSQLMEHWSSSDIHNLSSQMTGDYLRQLSEFYKDMTTTSRREFPKESMHDSWDFPTYEDLMFVDDYEYINEFIESNLPISKYFSAATNGTGVVWINKTENKGPTGSLKWNSKKAAELQNRYINQVTVGVPITNHINQKQVDLTTTAWRPEEEQE